MHHALSFYGQHQKSFLKIYITLAKLTSMPLAGALVRYIANAYARNAHSAYLLTTAQAEQIIDSAEKIALGPCSCREVFQNCHNPIMSELVLGSGNEAFRERNLKQISKEEAKEVVRQAHRNRLTHTIVKCSGNFYALCNCCSCCCVPTRLRQKYGINYALIRKDDVVAEFQKHQL